MKLKQLIDKYITDALDKGLINGLGIYIAQNGKTIMKETFGKIESLGGKSVLFEADTILDVGNLKEVVATLPLILKLIERRRKKIALNHPVSNYLPEFREPDKTSIQLMNLLTHTSGLPNDSTIHLEDIPTVKLDAKPGTIVKYSELNFKFIPSIFEIVSKIDFKEYLDTYIFDPLLMEQTYVIQEENHNFHLFSTLSDLSHFAEMIANDGMFDFIKIIQKNAVQLSKQNFTSFLNENRGLGWQLIENGYGFVDNNYHFLWWNSEKRLTLVCLITSDLEEEAISIRKTLLAEILK